MKPDGHKSIALFFILIIIADHNICLLFLNIASLHCKPKRLIRRVIGSFNLIKLVISIIGKIDIIWYLLIGNIESANRDIIFADVKQ